MCYFKVKITQITVCMDYFSTSFEKKKKMWSNDHEKCQLLKYKQPVTKIHNVDKLGVCPGSKQLSNTVNHMDYSQKHHLDCHKKP